MSKIKILRGLPATGKTTRAKEIIKNSGNYVRLNRDSLRSMLHFDKFTPMNEKTTIKVMKTIARELLNDGKNIIIDDTNLGKKHIDSWSSIANETNSNIEIEDLNKDIDFRELFDRDQNREKKVGRDVIIRLGIQHDIIKPEHFGDKDKKWIICDIDGTIADLKHRLHYVKQDKKDWKSFFNEMEKDGVIEDIKDLVLQYKGNGYPIIFVSGRPDSHREQTKNWLENVAFKDIKFKEGEDYATILMRRSFDHRPDDEVKRDILLNYLKVDNVHTVIDDRPRVVRMWKSFNLPVIDVGPGVEF